MSAVNETPQLAAEAAPAASAADEKANEKDAVIVQILFQAAGKNFVPNFKAIKAPDRIEKAVKHIWDALKKSYASVKDGNGTSLITGLAKGEGVAKGGSKKRKVEIEGRREGVAKKKKKVTKKTHSEPKIEESVSDNGVYSESYGNGGYDPNDPADTISYEFA
ncbi:hypothetical protein EAE96_004075 [Botrytis aclada]|nr:hypothetical protein EAE96_004075 [Botrytis aclada]